MNDVIALQNEITLFAVDDAFDVDLVFDLFVILATGDGHRPFAGPVQKAPGLGDGLKQGDLAPLADEDVAGTLHLSEDVDVDALGHRYIDDVPGFEFHIELGGALHHQAVEIDDLRLVLSVRSFADQDHPVRVLPGDQSLRLGDDFQQGRLPHHLVVPRLLDRADDRDHLALILLDEDGHLRVAQVLLFKLGHQMGLDLGSGLACDHHLADEGQGDFAVLPHPHGGVELRHIEDADGEQVFGADAVLVVTRCLGGQVPRPGDQGQQEHYKQNIKNRFQGILQ